MPRPSCFPFAKSAGVSALNTLQPDANGHCRYDPQAGLQSELELATSEIDRTAQRLMTLEREKERLKVDSYQSCQLVVL